MDLSNVYEIADNNQEDQSGYQMQHITVSSNEAIYQHMIENAQETPKHYEELQRIAVVDHSLANKSDATASINRAKSLTRSCCIAIIFLIVLISVFSILGAVIMSVVNHINLSSQQNELNKLRDRLNTTTTDERAISNIITRINCGEGTWHRIAFLNVSSPLQSCPSPWSLYSNFTYGVRGCGRPFSNSSSCSPKYYYPNRQFNRVCGRVIGYQLASPDGLKNADQNINENYIDGVSLCIYRNDSQRTHLWSYVGCYNEREACSSNVNSFVGRNYYCESAIAAGMLWRDDELYASDPLWDGHQCEIICCIGAPWFNVRLPTYTSDPIEVRICGDEGTANENTPINLLEIFVQ